MNTASHALLPRYSGLEQKEIAAARESFVVFAPCRI
jgi:hypothetical protein